MKRFALLLVFSLLGLAVHARNPDWSFDMKRDTSDIKWQPVILELSGKTFHMILIPEKQTEHSWREQLEQQIFFTGKTPAEVEADWEKRVSKGADDAVFTRTTLPDGSLYVDFSCKSKYQSGIRRFMKASDGVYTVAYYVRPLVRTKERLEFWESVVKEAKLIAHKDAKK